MKEHENGRYVKRNNKSHPDIQTTAERLRKNIIWTKPKGRNLSLSVKRIEALQASYGTATKSPKYLMIQRKILTLVETLIDREGQAS
jgi:hypothetical protein